MTNRKKILFVRTNAINPDPRLEKEVKFLSDKYDIEVLAWDRENESSRFEQRQGYSIRRCRIIGRYESGVRFLIKLIIWQFLEFVWLFKIEFDVVHACDFDTLIPAIIVAKLRRKRIVYDIFDFYGDAISRAPQFLKKFIRNFDIFLISFVDALILADDNRRKQIYGAKPKKLISVYNVPDDLYNQFNVSNKESNDFNMVFIGMIQKSRGFDSITNVVKNMPDVNLKIGGYGPYEKELFGLIFDVKNIELLGRISPYEKVLKIESESDCLFALYDPAIENHKYSSPNKLFEAMMLGKPIIVSSNTGMDELVKKYNNGIVVDYNNEQQLRCAILCLIEAKIIKTILMARMEGAPISMLSLPIFSKKKF